MTKTPYKELENVPKKSFFRFFKNNKKKVEIDTEYQTNYYKKTGIVRVKNDELTFLLSLIM